MNYIDVLLWLVILLAIWSGWSKGFIMGSIDLGTWIGSVFIAFIGYQYVASILVSSLKAADVWSAPVAFIFLLVLSKILMSSLLYWIFPNSRDVHQHTVNRALGLLPGFLTGLINAAIIAALLLAFPISNNITATTRKSSTANILAGKIEWLDEKLAPVFDGAVKKSINNLVVHPGSDETVHLNFTVNNATPRQDLEVKMVELVNAERGKKGLSPLVLDPTLVQVGRSHSQDMFSRGYFSHYSLEGKTVSDRLKAAGVRFLVAGENLALAQTLTIAHNGLMESPGHRANILQPRYGRIGIGILDGGIYGLMITQVFKN
ncbi:CvpA family protein [Flavisolibacter tropicus]|uniref:Membrane protein n=1 Tax=Flavisolibacter tropicus TaxID=1492898 RepID=A0A172TRY6_9BACT|nr:CvpA family protein [Flavisolibacter tropicus]ANE49790.1 membrane protein [Flavisolibacter tropicus]